MEYSHGHYHHYPRHSAGAMPPMAEQYNPATSMAPPSRTPSIQDDESIHASPGGPDDSIPVQTKRTRILLSCGPCRMSKLKCDRAQPCSQCVKKSRVEGCIYAPRPEKAKPAKSMAARLKRLESMVRNMMDGDEESLPSSEGGDFMQGRPQMVGSDGRRMTYVGATHFMAMLDDIEDLKDYFDDEEPEDDTASNVSLDTSESLMLSRGPSRTSKQDLLNVLPTRRVADRLTMRYFAARSPAQHIIHQPSFINQYREFWIDPEKADFDWLALLFIVLALGVFFSTLNAPKELEKDFPGVAATTKIDEYRAATASALVQTRWSSPSATSILPFLLYVDGEFLINRVSQMSSYLLIALTIRLMLKMGLHRDPDRLAGISAFDGEMRRRMWNLAIQVDLLTGFHTGLPPMIHGIVSDTSLPRNLMDEDLHPDMEELPPARPDNEYTMMSYPIWKGTMCRVFGLVVRQAHSLSLPAYPDVMKLDVLLEEKWALVPAFMKIRPLEESLTEPPHQITQRFWLAGLYQKTRCVLHRRYLIDATPKKEHEYSRRTCLEAAIELLRYQNTLYQATRPGGVLGNNGWLIAATQIHDFLLAAMVLVLVIENGSCFESNGNLTKAEGQNMPQLPNKNQLKQMLHRSHQIWDAVSIENPVYKKAADILSTMSKKIETENGKRKSKGLSSHSRLAVDRSLGHPQEGHPLLLAHAEQSQFPGGLAPAVAFPRRSMVPTTASPVPGTAAAWIPAAPQSMDWTGFDNVIRGANEVAQLGDEWMQQRSPLNELEYMAAGVWGQSSHM